MQDIGTDRWSWSNGIPSESIKQTLLAYGWLSHTHTKDVVVILPEDPDYEERFIRYQISLPPKQLRGYLAHKRRVKQLQAWSGWLIGRWLLVRTLEKGKLIDVDRNVRRFVRDYLGETAVEVEVRAWEPT